MIQFSQYESYKDSGIDWLGEIPNHWNIKKVKYVTDKIVDGTHHTPNYIDQGIPFLRVTDISQSDEINLDETKKISIKEHLNLCKRAKASKGDILLSKNGTIGITKVINWEFDFSFFVSLCLIKPAKQLKAQFFCYFFQSPLVYEQINFGSKRTSVTNLHLDKIKELLLPVPPLDEQQKIIKFLNKKTAEIDEAIAKKQKLIELLQEQKSILINRAVTKGLNPNVTMRDSGIEWIGKIPEHWNIKKLGLLSNLLQTGPFGSQLHQEEYVEDKTPIINPSQLIDGKIVANKKITVSKNVVARLSRHKLHEGDLVFGRRGEMGRCGLVQSGQVGWICGTGSILFRPKQDIINSEFALISFTSQFMKSSLEYISIGATMENLNTSILSEVSIPLPPVKEQKEIVGQVSNIENSYSLLVKKELKLKDTLKELKQVLISNAVTGKIKI